MRKQLRINEMDPRYMILLFAFAALITILGFVYLGTTVKNTAPLEPIAEPEVIEPIVEVMEPEPIVAETFILTHKKINQAQAELLIYAFNVAKEDGHKDPAVLQGLIWQESQAGGFPGYEVAGDEYGLKFGKRYYGIGQIKVSAAKDVFKRFPEAFPEFINATDELIIAHLIMDPKFNIRVASKYLWHIQHNQKTKYVRPTNYAITAYNRGLGNTYGTDYNNWHYTVGVHKHKDTFIKTFNTANNVK